MVELPGGPEDSYVCIKAKASTYVTPKEDPRKGARNKVEYIVTYRQRCECGDHRRGARSAGNRQESIHYFR